MNASAKINALSGIGIIVLFAFFLGLGSYPLMDPGDGYFAEASREMLARGEYIVPYLNGQIYFSKPIMIYWLIIGSYKLLGVNELAARLPSALMATGTVLLTYWMAYKMKGVRAGFIAAAVLAAAPLFSTFARMCLVDMAFTAWLTAALAATMATLAGSKRTWFLIYLALAGAVLTKGPAALALFGAGLLLYALINRDQIKSIISQLRILPGVCLLLACALPWFLAVGVATDWLWPQVFLVFENVDRFQGQTNHRNGNPLFYLWVLAYGFFPWSILALPLTIRLKQVFGHDRSASLLACFAVAVVVMFTLSGTKLQTYILPAFPAIAVLLGLGLESWMASFKMRQERAIPLSFLVAGYFLAAFGLVCGLLSAILTAEVLSGHAIFPDHNISAALKVTTAAITGLCAIFCFVQTWFLVKQAKGPWFKSLIAANCACSVLAVGIVFQVGYEFTQADLNNAIQPLVGQELKDGDVAIFLHFKPSVMFYLHHSVDSYFHADQLTKLPYNSPFKQYILATNKQAPMLRAQLGDKLELVKQSGNWALYSAKDTQLKQLPTLSDTFKSRVSLSQDGFHWGTLPFAGVGGTL